MKNFLSQKRFGRYLLKDVSNRSNGGCAQYLQMSNSGCVSEMQGKRYFGMYLEIDPELYVGSSQISRAEPFFGKELTAFTD